MKIDVNGCCYGQVRPDGPGMYVQEIRFNNGSNTEKGTVVGVLTSQDNSTEKHFQFGAPTTDVPEDIPGQIDWEMDDWCYVCATTIQDFVKFWNQIKGN